ncbi:MAG: biotin--[acetyl-CoA-carboxylase] ligase [Planctomycetota bacterium]
MSDFSIDGWRIESHDILDSTQALLRERLAIEAADRLLVIADEQRRGRGRRHSGWGSPRGGLWLSFSLRTSAPADPFLGLIVALAARDAVASFLGGRGKSLRLKWPNDLVVGEGKWGGVLAEAETHRTEGMLLLFGVGLNLDIPRERLLEIAEIPEEATSVRAEIGWSPSPAAVLSRMLARLDRHLGDDARQGGRDRTRRRVAAQMSTLGRRIRWRALDGSLCTGEAEELTPEGALRVRLDAGARGEPPGATTGAERILRAEDVMHVRSLR